jgi:hypothetical protein
VNYKVPVHCTFKTMTHLSENPPARNPEGQNSTAEFFFSGGSDKEKRHGSCARCRLPLAEVIAAWRSD